LTDIDLFEVSVVTFPAYEQTSVSARTKLENAKEKKLNLRKGMSLESSIIYSQKSILNYLC